MKDNILEQIGQYRAPSKLPPIAMKAYSLYTAGGSKLNDEAIGELRKELQAYGDDLKPLTDAIVGLGAFAIYVRDNLKDPAAAEAVAKLIHETAPKYASIGQRIAAALQDLANKATDLLDRFTDREAPPKTAPKFGEDAPQGTVPLKALKPVGGPPPAKNPAGSGGKKSNE
jgi:hypothetical protein